MDIEAQRYLEEVKQSYPDLKIKHIKNSEVTYEGSIAFKANYEKKGLIEDQFEVEISFPLSNSVKIPKAIETGGRIPSDFHQYTDSTLCLGAPLEVLRKYGEQPSLQGFINNVLVPYFYSFSYKEKYGEMPFGELSHGGSGIVEYYKELFDTNSELVVLELLKIIIENNYRGHIQCPCRSQNHIRDCHGLLIIDIKEQLPREQFLYELCDCIRAYKKSGKELPISFFTKRLKNYAKKVCPPANKQQKSN